MLSLLRKLFVIAHYAACRRGPQLAQQDSSLGTRIQTSRHTSESWIQIGKCLRSAGILPGSNDELSLFRWAMDPECPRPRKLYQRVIGLLRESGVYLEIPKIGKRVRAARPMDAEVLRWVWSDAPKAQGE